MEIFKRTTHWDFMGSRKPAMALSIVLIVVSLASLAVRGLNLGIDFTGGTVIEAGYTHPVELTEVREALSKGGFKDAVVQHFGTSQDILIRLAARAGETSAALSERVLSVLRQAAGDKVEMRRVEFVGPQVGGELAEAGGLSLLIASLGILVYVALRFEYRMALGAIIAMLHDPIVVLGWFSLFQVEFDLTVLAAVLAVIGYSINDTVVVFDRIRENFRKVRKASAEEIVNLSVNQTLSRTIMTSFATMLVVVSMLVLGGSVIHGFALALLIGVIIGTYSSIFIASPVALMLGISRANLLPVKKEGEEADQRP